MVTSTAGSYPPSQVVHGAGDNNDEDEDTIIHIIH